MSDISIELMHEALDAISALDNEYWMSTLCLRKKDEMLFHDQDRDRKRRQTLSGDAYEQFYGNRKYYTATASSKAYVDTWIAHHAPGKIFLDYACGDGVNAIKAAAAGTSLAVGLDISQISVQNASRDATVAGVSANCRFVQADAENTRLPDDSIDVIICSGMLHHLDLSYCFPELRRILAPGGIILCVEALAYNPFIQLYRKLTPSMRTKWEAAHILGLNDIDFARRFFDIGEIHYWHILNILSAHLPRQASLLNSLDEILCKIPLVRLLAWIFTFELKKRDA